MSWFRTTRSAASDEATVAKPRSPSDELEHLLAEERAIDAAGRVNGRHYTEYVEDVKALKRAGRLDEAEALLLKLIAATQRESERAEWGLPAPWYTEQLAIVYRKQGRHADEVAILESYLASVSPRRRSEMAGMAARLTKARALAGSV